MVNWLKKFWAFLNKPLWETKRTKETITKITVTEAKNNGLSVEVETEPKEVTKEPPVISQATPTSQPSQTVPQKVTISPETDKVIGMSIAQAEANAREAVAQANVAVAKAKAAKAAWMALRNKT